MKLTGLGVTEAAKKQVTNAITKAVEKAVRWLWIKRTDRGLTTSGMQNGTSLTLAK